MIKFKEILLEDIKYIEGKSFQKGKNWSVYADKHDSGFNISVNSSSSWGLDSQDQRQRTFVLMDAGKLRASLYFKEGNIDKLADEMYELNDKTTWGETEGLTPKDYADIIRLWIDMKMNKV